jgi:four helix bundle protein
MVNSKKIKNFKELRIWQESIELVEEIYRITKKFPKEELYGIVNQIRRSAVSLPSNIAEGFMRHHNKESKVRE